MNTKAAIAFSLAMGLFTAAFTNANMNADEAVQADPESPLRWYKGNLHTHSFWSDGNDFPEMIAEWYRTHDYNFLALSDHNILSKSTRWMNIRDIDRRSGSDALEKYLERFGEHWIETRGDRANDTFEVRLKPLNEFRSLEEERGKFILIQGEEISDGFAGLPIHINATNLQNLIVPQHGDGIADTIRNNLQAVEKQAEETGQPIIAHLNHPNFVWAITAEEIAEVLEEKFFEVYNGHTGVNNAGNAERANTEHIWDVVNTLRITEFDAAPMYGLSTDDSHSYHGHSNVSIPGRGWIMVRARHLTPESIINAMKTGDFYSSTGVTLNDVRFNSESGIIEIEIEPAEGESYTTHFIGTRKGVDTSSEPIINKDGMEVHTTRKYSNEIGEVLAKVEGLSPSYKLTGDELYVRAVVISSKEPENATSDNKKKKAWTQPVGW